MTDDPMTSMNISLPESLRRFAETRAARGYGSVSEYFRELLRQDRKRIAEERLDGLLLEGLESGPAEEVTSEYWKAMKRRLAERLRKARGEKASSQTGGDR